MTAASLADGDWPLFGLTLRTEHLELRMPTDDDLVGLLAAVRMGIVGSEPYPFTTNWCDDPEPQRTRAVLAYHWQARAGISADDFNLPLAVVLDGTVIGTQGVVGQDFQARKTFGTGSWIAKPWQGQGLAKEMRAAALTFGFDCLGGDVAMSSARLTTERSIRVTTGLGYRENGRRPARFGDDVGEEVEFRLDRAQWRARPDRPAVDITGWDACASMFRSDEVEPS